MFALLTDLFFPGVDRRIGFLSVRIRRKDANGQNNLKLAYASYYSFRAYFPYEYRKFIGKQVNYNWISQDC